MMRCPFCHAGIETREEGVRCARCQAPHHLACWNEYAKCSVFGCGSTAHKALTALGTARVVIAAGRRAVTGALIAARERLGGKSVVLLFMLCCLLPGLGLAPLIYKVHATRKVEIEFIFASLFVILASWIATLLYRGTELADDMQLKLGERNLGSYYFFMPNNAARGCFDAQGCNGPGGCSGSSSSDIDGVVGGIILIVLAVVVIFVVLPFLAWLAVEVLFPCIVLAIYFTLYGALAFAVNGQQALAGRLLPCIARAIGYATVYTGVVALLMAVAVRLFHQFAPPH